MCLRGEEREDYPSGQSKGLSEAKARLQKPVCSNTITQREIDRLHALELESHYKVRFATFSMIEFGGWS